MAKANRIKVGSCTKNQLAIHAGGYRGLRGQNDKEWSYELNADASERGERLALFDAPQGKIAIASDADAENFTRLAVALIAETDLWENQRSAGQIRRQLAAAFLALDELTR